MCDLTNAQTCCDTGACIPPETRAKATVQFAAPQQGPGLAAGGEPAAPVGDSWPESMEVTEYHVHSGDNEFTGATGRIRRNRDPFDSAIGKPWVLSVSRLHFSPQLDRISPPVLPGPPAGKTAQTGFDTADDAAKAYAAVAAAIAAYDDALAAAARKFEEAMLSSGVWADRMPPVKLDPRPVDLTDIVSGTVRGGAVGGILMNVAAPVVEDAVKSVIRRTADL